MRSFHFKFIIFCFSSFYVFLLQAQECTPSHKLKIRLLPSQVEENSSLALSKKFDRIYMMNDSGSDAIFYYVNSNYNQLTSIAIKGFIPKDVEAFDTARCGKADCLFIGDIGDNHLKRSHYQIAIIKEKKSYKKGPLSYFFKNYYYTHTKKIINFIYPDHKSRNAESMSIHPNGDIFIITKPGKHQTSKVVEIYVLRKELWEQSKNKEMIQIEKIQDFDLNQFGSHQRNNIITDIDISPDGESFLAITYGHIIHFKINLALHLPIETNQLIKDVDYYIYNLPPLAYQEAISWKNDGQGFLYSTEKKRSQPQFIVDVQCTN